MLVKLPEITLEHLGRNMNKFHTGLLRMDMIRLLEIPSGIRLVDDVFGVMAKFLDNSDLRALLQCSHGIHNACLVELDVRQQPYILACRKPNSTARYQCGILQYLQSNLGPRTFQSLLHWAFKNVYVPRHGHEIPELGRCNHDLRIAYRSLIAHEYVYVSGTLRIGDDQKCCIVDQHAVSVKIQELTRFIGE